MEKMIYFDMDGTIADFYRGTWLTQITAGSVEPYATAPVLVKEKTLLRLRNKGYRLGIISWLAKGDHKKYDKQVRATKKAWLKANYPNIKFDEIHIVKYGTPKWKVARCQDGILFDDEKGNRDEWKGKAYHPCNIAWFGRL